MPTQSVILTMVRVVAIAIGLMSLAACEKRAEYAAAPPASMLEVPSPEMAADTFALAEPSLAKIINIETRQKRNTLAYEHYVEVEIAKDLLVARVEAVRSACQAEKEGSCTLLEITSHEIGGVPLGSIKLRIAPSSVDGLSKLAGEGGRITKRHTSAEDLAQPIADTERQLALLNLHLKRLTEFMSRKDMKVADLITVSRELASVQSQLDDFGSQRTNMRRRVDTELLTIDWRPPIGSFESVETPVANALKSFSANFKSAIAQVITFVAYVFPWLVIGVPTLVLIGILRRRLVAWIVRRKATASSASVS